jgi:hypothetical protein
MILSSASTGLKTRQILADELAAFPEQGLMPGRRKGALDAL